MTEVKSVKKELVPPDGGWGWVVCFAYALNNVIVLPLILGFGLIFQQTFSDLGITATQTSIIINVNHAFGMVLSLFNGPLLKRFGYRKVALTGALCVSVGILITSRGDSFLHFLISYSIMTSVGVALTMSSFSLAINSFFRKNRGKALAVGMSITGLGPIFMPQVINSLIGALGIQGAVLVLGALSLHSVVAALLLRPVKWYMRPDEDVEKEKDENKPENGDVLSKSYELQDMSKPVDLITENADDFLDDKKITVILSSLEKDVENTNDVIAKKTMSSPDIRPKVENKRRHSWWESTAAEVNMGSSIDLYDESIIKSSGDHPNGHIANNQNEESKSVMEKSAVLNETNEPLLKQNHTNPDKELSLGMKIVQFFDLGLLKDPIFVNIMVGISIAACAEINFALLTPFILNDLKFDTSEIAAVMSVIAFSDIVFRFISPFIGDWCRKSARVMYLISLVMLICTRTSLFFASSYNAMLAVAFGLGVAKGVRSVYMSLVIPNYVPIERLAYASGIQMVTNGFVLMTIGPLLGFIRDRSGSYNISIIFINVVTSITILLWVGEFLYLKYRPKITVT